MKSLVLLRGLPGAGKSTLAVFLGGKHYEADSYFMVYRDPKTGEILNRHQYNGAYEFDPSKIKEAHEQCRLGVEESMSLGYDKITVSNTFTEDWELEPYYQLAKKYGYTVFSLIVENRHGGVNQHDVPKETIEKMRNRFTFKL